MNIPKTWASTEGDEENLSSFERKILRNKYGPVYDVDAEGGGGIRKKNE